MTDFIAHPTASEALPALCRSVLGGAQLGSRNGAVKEQPFTTIVLTKPWRREILTSGRKANVVAQIAETLWVLAGRNDVEWLSAYLPRAKDFSDDGETWRAGYGPRLRKWLTHDMSNDNGEIDQLAEVVRKLRANPEDRRAVISLWDPAVDNDDGKDVPCNNWLHFLVRDDQLHLHVATRSNDLMWGWSGINAFEWSALQEIVASLVGVKVGELHFAISSLHLYEPYWPKAERMVGRVRGEGALDDSPRFSLRSVTDLDEQLAAVFAFEARLRAGECPTRFANISDPMLASWARVLAWHWTKDEGWLKSDEGTRLYAATREMPKGVGPFSSEFAEWAAKLHAEKHALYGDSWKKRGEQVSIQANIARKIDRLGKAGAGDTEVDTTTDLLVYLVKYGLWFEHSAGTDASSHVDDVRRALLSQASRGDTKVSAEALEEALRLGFEKLVAEESRATRVSLVNSLTGLAYSLAELRWNEQKGRTEARDAALQTAPTGLRAAPTGLGQTHAERNAQRAWNPEVSL